MAWEPEEIVANPEMPMVQEDNIPWWWDYIDPFRDLTQGAINFGVGIGAWLFGGADDAEKAEIQRQLDRIAETNRELDRIEAGITGMEAQLGIEHGVQAPPVIQSEPISQPRDDFPRDLTGMVPPIQVLVSERGGIPPVEANMAGWGDPILEAAQIGQVITRTIQGAIGAVGGGAAAGGTSTAVTTVGRVIRTGAGSAFTTRIFRWLIPHLRNIGIITATMTAAEMVQAAFQWWLSNGTPRPPRRSMNPLNPKALRRATRRLARFNDFAKDTQRELARLAPPRRRAAGGTSYCNACRKNPCGC